MQSSAVRKRSHKGPHVPGLGLDTCDNPRGLAASFEAPPEDMRVTKTPPSLKQYNFMKHNSKRLRRESDNCPFPSILYTAEGQEREQ